MPIMRPALAIFIALAAGPAAAQPAELPQFVYAPGQAPPPVAGAWNPTSAYVTPGQDEPGYRAWYARAQWRAPYVKAFNDYLATYQVAGVVPTWQLLRTASSWRKCGSEPFEVPPVNEWPHIVQTLRYVRDYVVPAVGPVESVSGYRNPHLNVCAGGAPASAHKSYSAIDLVPLRPTSRQQLMSTLCAVHSRKGDEYGVGLGFYAYLRFHVDTTKFRRWGASANSGCPSIIRPEDVATVPPQPPETPPVDPLAPVLAPATTAVSATEPQAVASDPPPPSQ